MSLVFYGYRKTNGANGRKTTLYVLRSSEFKDEPL